MENDLAVTLLLGSTTLNLVIAITVWRENRQLRKRIKSLQKIASLKYK